MTLQTVTYRVAELSDVPAMAAIRALEWGTEENWNTRIMGYLNGEVYPQHALRPRVSYVACNAEQVLGFVAGHLTRRHGCDGELEWINVIPEHRGSGIASGLIQRLAQWFIENQAKKVCIDVQPTNLVARKFYCRHGATDLNPHWMVWNDVGVVLANH